MDLCDEVKAGKASSDDLDKQARMVSDVVSAVTPYYDDYQEE